MKLIAKNLSFKYHKSDWIFKDLSFEINEGEIIGITAPSGFGKSTFSNVLCGNLKPQHGEVLLDNKPANEIKGFNPVQVVFQHPEKALNPRLTMQKSLTEAYTPSKERMEQFGIKDKWLSRWPNELSGGELQRFCLLRLLTDDVKFLILDEISTMLDPVTQAQIWTAILNIAKEKNIALLVISHNDELVKKVCQKTFDLRTCEYKVL